MNWRDFVDGLKFHDNDSFNQHLQAVSDIEMDSIVLNGLLNFRIDMETTRSQFVS